jgi:hypothetical protein
MELLINELQQKIISFNPHLNFACLVVALRGFGYSNHDIKKAMISLRELKIIEIDKVDFVKIDYLLDDRGFTLNEWINE